MKKKMMKKINEKENEEEIKEEKERKEEENEENEKKEIRLNFHFFYLLNVIIFKTEKIYSSYFKVIS